MDTQGRHLLVEYLGCSPNILNRVKDIQGMMEEAAKAANTVIVASVFQPFEPQGVSGVVVIEESHLSIHTWPEFQYAAVDFYTCGKGVPDEAHKVLLAGLEAQKYEIMRVARGNLKGGPSMKVY